MKAKTTLLGANLESRESTNEFERMDLDELQSMQEDLKRKIQTTNQLIESKSRSNSYRSSTSDPANNLVHIAQENKNFISGTKLQEKHFLNQKNSSLSRSPPKRDETGKTLEAASEDRMSRV